MSNTHINQQLNSSNNLNNQIKEFRLKDFFNPNKSSKKIIKKDITNAQPDIDQNNNSKINRISQNNFFSTGSNFLSNLNNFKNFEKQTSQKDSTQNNVQKSPKKSFLRKSIDKIFLNGRESSQFNEIQFNKLKTIQENQNEKYEIPTFKKLSQFKVDPQRYSRKSLKRANIKMDFNVCQIILRNLCFCCLYKKLRLKRELYDHGYMKFLKHMSVISFIRKMHEIDLIKDLMLDEKQVTLFNFVSKPSVSLLSKNEIIETLQEKFNTEFNKEEIDHLYDTFHKMAEYEIKSEMDKKLLLIVASEIDHLVG
jgi:hypothetical protein